MAHRTRRLTVPKLCCVCMAIPGTGVDINWLNIHTDSFAGQHLKFILEETTGREVKPAENLPECICPSCLTLAKIAFNFKRRLEQSLKLLTKQIYQHESSGDGPHFHQVKNFQSNTPSAESDIEEFESLTEEETLLNIGKAPFECTHCSKSFSHKSNLRVHLRTHTGERPFECSHCSKSFIGAHYLKVHLRTHTGERPYKCSECFRSFTQKGTLNNHLRIHTGDRPFKCSICSKNYNNKGKLEEHQRTHTGERPFKCSECSMTFVRNGNLKRHLLTHNGDRPFRCSHCSKSFLRTSDLNRHVLSHSDELPHE